MIIEYLQDEKAGEDVRKLLADSPKRMRGNGTFKPEGEAALSVDDKTMMTMHRDGAWMRIRLCRKRVENMGEWIPLATIYCRAHGDLFIVSDLGEGWRALRIQTGRIDWTTEIIAACDYNPNIVDAGGELSTTGDCEMVVTKAAELPDAICRVLLASYRVAQLAHDPRFKGAA